MKKTIGLLALTVTFTCGFFVRPTFDAFLARAERSEAIANLADLVTAERAYLSEFGKVSTDPRAIAFHPEGRIKFQIFMTREQLPTFLRSVIPERYLPFTENKSFRFLAAKVNGKGNEIELVTIDEELEILSLHMSLSSRRALEKH